MAAMAAMAGLWLSLLPSVVMAAGDVAGAADPTIFDLANQTWRALKARQEHLPSGEMTALVLLVVICVLLVLSRFGVFKRIAHKAAAKAQHRLSNARGEFASIILDLMRVGSILGGFAIVLLGIHAAIQLSGP